MECVFAAIVLLMIGVVAAAVLYSSLGSRRKAWNLAFAQVAARFHGDQVRGGWFREHAVRFLYGASHARLTCHAISRSGGRRCLQLVLQHHESFGRSEIHSQPVTIQLAVPAPGMHEAEIDWSGWHKHWQVFSADPDDCKHLLSSGTRLALDRLWLHPLPTDTAVSLMPGWIVIRKVWDQPRGVDIEEFVELACTVSDQLHVAAAAGIEFVESDEAHLIDQAVCSICGDAFQTDVVTCSRCKTPHHRDCWDYGGGCSTYGCGGRMYHLPHPAPMASGSWSGVSDSARVAKPR